MLWLSTCTQTKVTTTTNLDPSYCPVVPKPTCNKPSMIKMTATATRKKTHPWKNHQDCNLVKLLQSMPHANQVISKEVSTA